MGLGWSTPRPGRFIPGTYCIGSWVGPRAGLDGCGKSGSLPGFDPRQLQPLSSRYTDWPIPAPYLVLIRTQNNAVTVLWVSSACDVRGSRATQRYGEESSNRIRQANTHTQQFTSSGFEPDMGVWTWLLLFAFGIGKEKYCNGNTQEMERRAVTLLVAFVFPFRKSYTRVYIAGDINRNTM